MNVHAGLLRKILIAVVLLAAVSALFLWILMHQGKDEEREYVGSDACAGCHQQQHAEWKQSDHHLAMAHATVDTVLGDFNATSLDYFGRKTTFHRDGERFLVTTENQQGVTETYTVKYTLGHRPLQQYLVEFADGRVQTLPFSWDTRDKKAGGQRWFHIYPEENITPQNPLFWTRPMQNWNYMCADCHTTRYAKNFDDETNTFHSEWSELGNGCESCHGPGSAHVEKMQAKTPAHHETDFLINKLHTQTGQMDNCGVCHARRSRLMEDPANEKMGQTWQPELLHQGLYYDDGRMQDEVFNVGSFMQSKMYASGLTCTTCHEPHSRKMKHEGNALCTQCHSAEQYDTTKHHASTVGAQCKTCHMPTQTYMVIDKRHDHYFSLPKPEGKNAIWLARQEQEGAEAALLALISNQQESGIVRATALIELGRYLSPENLRAALDQLSSADPVLRVAAVQTLSALPAAQRAEYLERLLVDPSRAVRFAVAPVVADIDESLFSVRGREKRKALFAEYTEWLKRDSDRASALVGLASFHMALGNRIEAKQWFEKALLRDETSLTALLNYADYCRGEGNEAKAAELLRRALEIYPDSADAYYALGLQEVRQSRHEQALRALKKAKTLAPDNSQFAYVYALGLYASADKAEALAELAHARRQFPANTQIRDALVAYCSEQEQTGRMSPMMKKSCRL